MCSAWAKLISEVMLQKSAGFMSELGLVPLPMVCRQPQGAPGMMWEAGPWDYKMHIRNSRCFLCHIASLGWFRWLRACVPARSHAVALTQRMYHKHISKFTFEQTSDKCSSHWASQAAKQEDFSEDTVLPADKQAASPDCDSFITDSESELGFHPYWLLLSALRWSIGQRNHYPFKSCSLPAECKKVLSRSK